jgi:hypothetical protein
MWLVSTPCGGLTSHTTWGPHLLPTQKHQIAKSPHEVLTANLRPNISFLQLPLVIWQHPGSFLGPQPSALQQ